MYNLTYLQTSETPYDLVIAANVYSGNFLFGALLLVVFFVLVSVMKFSNWTFAESFASSSFICFVLSVFLVYSKLLNPFAMWGFLIMLALSMFYIYVKD